MARSIKRSRIPIVFTIEGIGKAYGTLIKVRAPLTVEAILRSLPFEGRASLWKREVYFSIPVKRGEEKATLSVERGDIAFWPMGGALCIFLAPIRPYSPVNLIGKVEKELGLFEQVKSGTKIRVEIAKEAG